MPTRRSFLKASAAFAAMPAIISRSASAAGEIKVATIFDQSGGLDLYGKPMHPYTRGLMHSIPRMDQPPGMRLGPIKGQPPNLAQLPPGCSFNPRCGEVIDRCRRDVPELMKADDKHSHACWVAPHV